MYVSAATTAIPLESYFLDMLTYKQKDRCIRIFIAELFEEAKK